MVKQKIWGLIIIMVSVLLLAMPITVYASDTNAVLTLVNQERANAGLAPLQLNACLQNAAVAHASDMATSNYFSHTGLNNSTPTSRANSAGYSGGVGENIAAGNGTAQATFTQWMGSSGHRANILNPGYQSIGIGYGYNAGSTYGHYWVQVFGLSTNCNGSLSAPASVPSASNTNVNIEQDATNNTTTIRTTTNTQTTNTTKQVKNPFGTWDGRLNDGIAPAVIYCSDVDFEIWTIDNLGTGGIFSFGASRSQIQTALNQAISTGTNTRIAGSTGLSLWALASREIQLQSQLNGGTYDFIFPADACGTFGVTATPPTTTTPTITTPDSSIAPYNATTTITTPGALSGQTYIVQPGDNLFRIALNNGVDMNILAAYNNITDPTRIYAGQVLRFP